MAMAMATVIMSRGAAPTRWSAASTKSPGALMARKVVLIATAALVLVAAATVVVVGLVEDDDAPGAATCDTSLAVPEDYANAVNPEFKLADGTLTSQVSGDDAFCFDNGTVIRVSADSEEAGATTDVSGGVPESMRALAATAASPNDCIYFLTPPFRVRLASGVSVVSATLTPMYCVGTAYPTSSRVCVSPYQGAGNCGSGFGYNLATAFIGPWMNGMFTSSGVACAAAASPPSAICKRGVKYANPPA